MRHAKTAPPPGYKPGGGHPLTQRTYIDGYRHTGKEVGPQSTLLLLPAAVLSRPASAIRQPAGVAFYGRFVLSKHGLNTTAFRGARNDARKTAARARPGVRSDL